MAGRVLIADDLATNRIVLKVKLSAASYDVIQATGGDELLQRAQRDRPDLVIIDGAFQNDRAIDLCQDLMDNPETAAIPVLIVAAGFSAADRLAALHAGAFDVLAKPFDSASLLARVRNILRVKSIEQELLLRRSTALELGFQEPAASFCRPAQVVVVEGRDGGGGGGEAGGDTSWQDPFRQQAPCHIHRISHEQLLETIGSDGLAPDVIVLPAQIEGEADGLFLLAELRSRHATRHAAIVVINRRQIPDAGITALDMGASDVIDAGTPGTEVAFRLLRQLRRKLDADRLRDTLHDGLRLAMTDPLTGLFNRRYALPHLARVAENAARCGHPFAVMVLDLDRFKRINDTYGHAAGDRVLCEVAARLRSNVRSVDLIARIGGEEFLVVMPDTDLKSARIAAERLRRVTSGTPIALGGGNDPIVVTASIGVSICGRDGDGSAPVEAMMERADRALLGAKSTGRNQVMFEDRAAA